MCLRDMGACVCRCGVLIVCDAWMCWAGRADVRVRACESRRRRPASCRSIEEGSALQGYALDINPWVHLG